MVTAQQIKELREKTGAGISDVKKALEDSGGDMVKAEGALVRKLGGSASKRAGRTTGAGIVDVYLHSNEKMGVMIELFCETDFVARNPAFRELAHDLAMQVAAMRPIYLSFDAVPRDVWDLEKSQVADEVKKMGKPAQVAEQIIDGKLKAFFGAISLLEQPFVKDQDKTIKELINEAIGKFGENIKVGKFVRFEI
ncbi:MAG: elongation factor Ts [Candidatus Sungbacteria bacterium]|nr:elongation factor Ts [Candidatus Sungbacteria bacterium]